MVFSLTASLGAGFIFFVLKGGLTFTSLPLSVYLVWLCVIILSSLFGFLSSPVEKKLCTALSRAMCDLRNTEAESLIQQASQLFYVLPRGRIELDRLKASFYETQGDLLKAYKILHSLFRFPLLPTERKNINIDLLQLLLAGGNYKAVKQGMARLQKGKLSSEQSLKLVLMRAELHIIDNQLQTAKDLLEDQLLNTQSTLSMQVSLLHTLAVAETHQQNYQNAAACYRKAWSIQKNLKNSFAQAEITVGNLVLNYAKQGEVTKIQGLLDELEGLAQPNAVDQQLAIHNIKLSLARQLSDREAVVDIYRQASEQLLPKLSGESKFFYRVHELRMHWNDEIDFEEALIRSRKAMTQRPAMSALKQLHSLKEVIGTVIQAMKKLGPRQDLIIYHNWLIVEFQRLQPELDQLLDEIPPTLPGPKDALLRLKVESIKYGLAFHQHIPKIFFDELFQLLGEQKSLWHGMHNTEGQLEALILTLDEYTAFKQQLAAPQFENDYKAHAFIALDEAEQLLVEVQQNLGYSGYLVGMAYYCYQLNTKKEQAKLWLEAYDKSKQSLNHNAIWLRQQYVEAKAWVSS